MIDLVDKSGLSDQFIQKRAGISVNILSRYRSGGAAPSAAALAWILETIGATFRVEDNNLVTVLPLSLNQMRALSRRKPVDPASVR